MSRSLPLVALSGLLLGAAPVLAQGPGPRGGDASPKKAAGAGEEPALAPGELRVRAESYEQVEKGRFEARGLVHMRLGAMRIQADKAGLALFDLNNPECCLKRGDEWVLAPEASYERHGDVDKVVFPCGYTLAPDGDTLRIYYGAADTSVAMATGSIGRLLHWLYEEN